MLILMPEFRFSMPESTIRILASAQHSEEGLTIANGVKILSMSELSEIGCEKGSVQGWRSGNITRATFGDCLYLMIWPICNLTCMRVIMRDKRRSLSFHDSTLKTHL